MTRPVLHGASALMPLHRAVREADGQIRGEVRVLDEVALDVLALVAEGDDEVLVSPVGVVLHDVPEHRPPADLDHRLGPAARLLRQATPRPPGKYCDPHNYRISSALRRDRAARTG